MGGTALSITDGNLTVGGNVVGAPSDSIVTGNSNVAIQPDGSITVSANNSSWSFGSIQADALSWPDGTWQATAFQGTATTAEGMSNVGNVAVTVDPLGSNYVWTYDTNGDTTMPGNLTVSNIAVQGKRIEFANGGYIEEAEVVDGNASPLGYYGVALNSSEDGLISMNALDSNAVATSSVIVSNVSVQLNVANSTPGGSPLSWLLDQSSRIILPNGGVISNDSDNIELQSANNVNVEAIGVFNLYTDTAGNTYQWQFSDLGVLTLPGEGILQSLDDTVNLVSLNTTSGYANSVYLGSSGGLGFSDQSAGGNWLEIFRSGATPEITSPTGNLKITTVVTGVSSNTWTYGTDGSITFPDNTVQTTAWTGSGGYSNVQVATYLPTYSGNVAAGNVKVSTAYRFETGNVTITNESGQVSLNPDTALSGTAGVKIGGSGFILGPNGARNLTLNYNSVSGALGLQGNVTIGTQGSGNLWVMGNIIARDIIGGNILTNGNIRFADGTTQTTAANYGNTQVAQYLPSYSGTLSAGFITVPGTTGKIGFDSSNFAQQTTSNATQVTSNTTCGNIQLMTINLGVNSVHTVAFACNQLTTNDVLLVKHIGGGITSVYVDAYVASNGLAVIWMRNISGADTGNFTPMLKYFVIQAPN